METRYLQEISDITKREQNLIYRGMEELIGIVDYGGIITKFENRKLIGFVMCKRITEDIYELASLYVKPEYRGMGIARELLAGALAKVEGKHIIARTSNKSLKNVLKQHNFKPVSMKYNFKYAYIYLKDRLENKAKFTSFLATMNKKNCLFVKSNWS